jgi:LDH2 family malate/lactate/ureidoglycolate dehydrogenase
MSETPIRIAAATIGAQLDAVFQAWGMPETSRRPTVEIMVETDLRGIDSHGLAMLPLYARLKEQGVLNVAPEIRVVNERPVTALIDADGGLGHAPAAKAMEMAIDKAKAAGLAAVAVRNSAHFGAAGAYAIMAAREGLIGMAVTNGKTPGVVPTRAKRPMFATNPIAFAAPAGVNEPFVLDMATSTVAIGKVKLAWFAGEELPDGWTLDPEGKTVTDAAEAFDGHGRLKTGYGQTPLGGFAEMSSHKGYGLAIMVEILSAMLSGARFGATREARGVDGTGGEDVGHFMLAIDPAAFRDAGDFAADMDDLIDALHATPPVDPSEPVLVAGDPETAAERERREHGVPVPAKLIEQVRQVCRAANAEFLLTDGVSGR